MTRFLGLGGVLLALAAYDGGGGGPGPSDGGDLEPDGDGFAEVHDGDAAPDLPGEEGEGGGDGGAEGGDDGGDDDGGDDDGETDGGDDRVRRIGPPCDPAATERVVSFVHVSDLHAGYRRDADGGSRYARLRAFRDRTAAESPYTVFTDGGDDYEKGSVLEQLSAGASTREATVALGFDVRVVGNHDFAWGTDEVLAFTRDPRAWVLASNTEYLGSDPGAFGGVDYAELEVGCLRVGFFGMVSKPWDEFNRQYTGDFLPEFRTRWDWAERARELVAAHRGGWTCW